MVAVVAAAAWGRRFMVREAVGVGRVAVVVQEVTVAVTARTVTMTAMVAVAVRVWRAGRPVLDVWLCRGARMTLCAVCSVQCGRVGCVCCVVSCCVVLCDSDSVIVHVRG